jgi:hypothetical protein
MRGTDSVTEQDSRELVKPLTCIKCSFAGAREHPRGTDEHAGALLRELDRIIENDRYPLSPRVLTLKEIRAMLRPEPAREPLPPPKRYGPPRAGRRRR